MQTQVKTFRQTLTYIAKSALVLAGAGIGMAVGVECIPASIASPVSIVVPAAFAPGSAPRGGLPSVRRSVRESKAASSGCDTRLTCKVRMDDVAGGMRRCAHRAQSAAVPSGVSQGAQDADLLILLDWHMTASNGYGFSLDIATCSAKAGSVTPMPLQASEAYEILARFRDESGDALADTGGHSRDLDDPAAALRQGTE